MKSSIKDVSGADLARLSMRGSCPDSLHWITAQEKESLRVALAEGRVPADFATKLSRLTGDGAIHQFVEQNSRVIIALLMAAYTGAFRGAAPKSLDRLLTVLAYVRKDQDAKPDDQPGGFADDQQELRTVTNEFAPLFESFKSWRLRYQVPGMWLDDRTFTAGEA